MLRSPTAAEGIPEGFRSDESGRVAPRGEEALSPGTPWNLIRETGWSVSQKLGDSFLRCSVSTQILIDPRRHLSAFGNGPDDERDSAYDFADGGPAPTSAAPSRSNAVSAF